MEASFINQTKDKIPQRSMQSGLQGLLDIIEFIGVK